MKFLLDENIPPSVVLFRWQVITALSVFQFLTQHLPQLEENLLRGALIVVDEHKVRVRLLPLLP